MTKPSTARYAPRTKSIGVKPAQRHAVAVAHALHAARAFITTRCPPSPERDRHARALEHAVEHVLPADPGGAYGEGTEADDE